MNHVQYSRLPIAIDSIIEGFNCKMNGAKVLVVLVELVLCLTVFYESIEKGCNLKRRDI